MKKGFLLLVYLFIFISFNSLAAISPAMKAHSAVKSVGNIAQPIMLGENTILFDNGNWMVLRNNFSNNLTLMHAMTKQEIVIPDRVRRDNVVQAIETDADGNLYLVLYDAVSNTPSGRSLTGVTNSSYIFKLDAKTLQGTYLVESIELGGIDTSIYSSQWDGGIAVCSINQCFSIKQNGFVTNWQIHNWESRATIPQKFEFVEVVFNPRFGLAAAILRMPYDARIDGKLSTKFANYTVSVFSPKGSIFSTKIESDVPWKLTLNGNVVSYNLLSMTKNPIEVLVYDFNRLKLGGVLDFGVNNLEGRVVWSQLYYLNGMISALEFVDDKTKVGLLSRLKREVDVILDQCNTVYPRFRVKRYSMEREPLRIALHLSAINNMLVRLPYSSDKVEQCISSNNNYILGFNNTLEEVKQIDFQGQRIHYPFFRKGFPFWADGANAPFNFVSATIDNLATTNGSPETLTLVREFITPLTYELSSTPEDHWAYWWGTADHGWSSGSDTSVNTPKYIGNSGGQAHVTYLVMDAKAILAMSKYYPEFERFIPLFERMVSEGTLMPAINGKLTKDSRLSVGEFAHRRYSRAAYVWELESLPFALFSE